MIARKALDTIKTGIDYASDLAEVQNVVDVTFGSATEAINSWSKECLAAYGISDALGDTRVRAGSSVIVKLGLGDINVQSYLLVESVTHKFKQEQHLMDLKLRGGTFVT